MADYKEMTISELFVALDANCSVFDAIMHEIRGRAGVMETLQFLFAGCSSAEDDEMVVRLIRAGDFDGLNKMAEEESGD